MNLSRWKKGIAMDSYGASRNKKMKSDDEFPSLGTPEEKQNPQLGILGERLGLDSIE